MHTDDPALPLLTFEWERGVPTDEALHQEWLVTNGLGSYASGTVAACNTRRYHGLFTPTLPLHGRTVMVPRIHEEATVDGRVYRLDGEERMDGALEAPALAWLRRFQLRGTLPEWTYELGGALLERSLVFVHTENTVFIAWRNRGRKPVALSLRPFTSFRFHDRPLPPVGDLPVVHLQGDRIEMLAESAAPPLRVRAYGQGPIPFVGLAETSSELRFRVEHARGLDHSERQRSPGYFTAALQPGQTLSLGISVEAWEALDRPPEDAFSLELERQRKLLAHAPREVQQRTGARLVLAADQFIIKPSARPADEAWARATGQHARSVIAGYPWFTDWGRDTMISLEGLTLATGRWREADAILRTFQHYVRDGLLPNLFPEGTSEGLYHTADATLWFFHAVHRYLCTTGDLELLRDLYGTMRSIVDHHQRGTRYGIRVDPADGLLSQGAQGYQLTWMDAKVDGWVVTPRRGKAVEINALWFNALSLMQQWALMMEEDPKPYADAAARARAAFNARFWNEAEGCLFDVVDAEGGGDDPAVRPNQVFAISLDHPVLDERRWSRVLQRVERELVTPVGLRSLAPGHADYKARYDGDLRSRDAAYHQGTVWSWLIGHYVDAVRKTGADTSRIRAIMSGLEAHLRDAGLGTVSEIFDATEPFRARGCVAQAWGVAEMLRVYRSLAAVDA